ncbi:copper resistance protein NlpE [Shewanella sp.]|uniref:copper resistance protein NlpE n=1 Tax=Shewanella sp. TaxID=50422 RepID=UPI003562FBF9
MPGIHPQPIGDSSRTSLDWPGSYQGVLPCASCEGIKTQLTLNADGSYLLHTRYLGENEDKLIEEQGHFDWNERGGAIQLENGTWYQVGENQLFMLDQEGNRITGALAAHYRLAKSN